MNRLHDAIEAVIFTVFFILYCMFLSIGVFFGAGRNAGSGGIGAVLLGWVLWAVVGISTLLCVVILRNPT